MSERALRNIEDAFIQAVLDAPADELREDLLAAGQDPDALVREADDAFALAVRAVDASLAAEKAPAGGCLPAVASFW